MPCGTSVPLPPGEVHVWTASILDAPLLAASRELLAADEALDVARFVLEDDRMRAAMSRGLRRMLLAEYLNGDPRRLGFSTGPHGKPALADPDRALSFNMSHAGHLVAIAIARGVELGIDIELDRGDRDHAGIARHSFSLAERHAMAGLSRSVLRAGFYHCWTQKEAFIKLIGAGLHLSLDAFDVEVDPSRPPRLLAVHTPDLDARSYWMAPLALPDGYMGTVAGCGSKPTLRQLARRP